MTVWFKYQLFGSNLILVPKPDLEILSGWFSMQSASLCCSMKSLSTARKHFKITENVTVNSLKQWGSSRGTGWLAQVGTSFKRLKMQPGLLSWGKISIPRRYCKEEAAPLQTSLLQLSGRNDGRESLHCYLINFYWTKFKISPETWTCICILPIMKMPSFTSYVWRTSGIFSVSSLLTTSMPSLHRYSHLK